MQEPHGRATLVSYEHNTRELGNEVPTPKTVTINVRLGLRTAQGTATVKQRMRGPLAWLMEEGMSLPVLLDPATGLATRVDTDALETELGDRREESDRQAKDQARVGYALGVPDREEREQLRNDARGALRALRRVLGRR